MIRFLVLLFCCLVGAQSKCFRGPSGKLPAGCAVGNLTVAPYSSQEEIIKYMKCNGSADSMFFNHTPQSVGFQSMATSAPAYLIAAVDLTSKSVMWIVSNLTVANNWKFYPSASPRYTNEIIPWKKPSFSAYSPQHVIEFLVFEEYRNSSWSTYHNYTYLYTPPFNLSSWIQSQSTTGISLCGPVAGGSVVGILHSPAPGPGPTSRPGPGGSTPYKPPPPANHHHHKSTKGNSNRNLVNGALLVGVIFVYKVLAF
ncbi:uncharacterized protein rtp isoform X1 [Planococcus citri]|uniref:uncharacterized protein rtp isoform X1 n=1 Tax=Planococcus citri TaxID=170843 RepID=UPI0031F9F3C7